MSIYRGLICIPSRNTRRNEWDMQSTAREIMGIAYELSKWETLKEVTT